MSNELSPASGESKQSPSARLDKVVQTLSQAVAELRAHHTLVVYGHSASSVINFDVTGRVELSLFIDNQDNAEETEGPKLRNYMFCRQRREGEWSEFEELLVGDSMHRCKLSRVVGQHVDMLEEVALRSPNIAVLPTEPFTAVRTGAEKLTHAMRVAVYALSHQVLFGDSNIEYEFGVSEVEPAIDHEPSELVANQVISVLEAFDLPHVTSTELLTEDSTYILLDMDTAGVPVGISVNMAREKGPFIDLERGYTLLLIDKQYSVAEWVQPVGTPSHRQSYECNELSYTLALKITNILSESILVGDSTA